MHEVMSTAAWRGEALAGGGLGLCEPGARTVARESATLSINPSLVGGRRCKISLKAQTVGIHAGLGTYSTVWPYLLRYSMHEVMSTAAAARHWRAEGWGCVNLAREPWRARISDAVHQPIVSRWASM
jgi:hypothetical protein